MEEQKYFVPKIEDIYSGYEYERERKGKWEKVREFSNDYDYEDNPHYALMKDIQNGKIRVPYLTKKQIEAEGWKVENFPYNIIKGVKNTGIYDLNNDITGIEYNLFYRFENKRLSIESYIINYGKADRPYKGVNCIYFGECKDINTFRYICKLLEI